jgi:hypothetical protein
MPWSGSLVALAALILWCHPLSAAQPRVDRNCSDDRGIDRCSPEQQRRVRELFGVRSIEEHAAAGDQVRRVFYVDGYGRDVVALAFVRSPGRDPMLWVHFRREEDGARPEPLTAPVPGTVWQEVIERSAHFDRRFDPPPPAPARSNSEQTISLCIHSWVYTIESADPAAHEGPQPRVRRRTEDACEDGLGEAYAGELQRAAVPLLPHCSRLERSQHRNEASLLLACRLLSGDRLAAADVMNRADLLHDVEGEDDARLISTLFDYESVVDWNGERNEGTGSAASFWARRVGEGEGRTTLFYDTIHGETSNRVRLVGSLLRAGAGSGYEHASVEQIWTRVGDGEFQIERISVGPFGPLPAN